MVKNNLLITSQMPATSFITEWTGISNAVVWLEAEEKAKDSWYIYALGQTERGYSQRWAKHTLPGQDKLAPPVSPFFISNANNIHSAYCTLMAKEQNFPEMLSYLVFFEGLRQEGKMHHADIGDMHGLSLYKSQRYNKHHIYRHWPESRQGEKPDMQTLENLNNRFQNHAKKIYNTIKQVLNPS